MFHTFSHWCLKKNTAHPEARDLKSCTFFYMSCPLSSHECLSQSWFAPQWTGHLITHTSLHHVPAGNVTCMFSGRQSYFVMQRCSDSHTLRCKSVVTVILCDAKVWWHVILGDAKVWWHVILCNAKEWWQSYFVMQSVVTVILCDAKVWGHVILCDAQVWWQSYFVMQRCGDSCTLWCKGVVTVILCDAKVWWPSYFVMLRCGGDNSELGAGTALLHCCTGEILPVGWPLHHLLSLHHGSIQVLVDLRNNWHQVCEIWWICQSTKPITSQTQNTHTQTSDTNFRRVSPFNITPAKRAHKARTCWGEGGMHTW